MSEVPNGAPNPESNNPDNALYEDIDLLQQKIAEAVFDLSDDDLRDLLDETVSKILEIGHNNETLAMNFARTPKHRPMQIDAASNLLAKLLFEESTHDDAMIILSHFNLSL